MLDRTPHTKLNDWTRRHEYYLNKAKERLEINELKNKKIQDSRILIRQSLYEPGNLVKYLNLNPENKLSPSWKEPATIVTRHDNNNYSIYKVRSKINETELK